MNLDVIESVLLVEGGTQKICVYVDDLVQTRERDISISYFVVTHTANTSMYHL